MALNSIDGLQKVWANCISRLAYFSGVLLLALLLGCEDDASTPFDPNGLHGPLSMAVIPSSQIALVISTNFDFANSSSNPLQDGGAIHVIDLSTFSLDPASAVQLPNFAGQIRIDSARQNIFVADRQHNDLLVFHYTIPGTNRLIDITLTHTFRVGRNPFAVHYSTSARAPFNKLYIGNAETNDLSLINSDNLTVVDLDDRDDASEALRLDEVGVGSLNFSNQNILPNRMIDFGSDDLVLLSTSNAGLIYALDTKNDKIEALLNLQPLTSAPAIHGMAVIPNKTAFFASQGADAVMMLDLSELRDNGIDGEVILPRLIQMIPVNGDIEDMLTSPDNSTIYAANFSRGLVLAINATTGLINSEISVGQGPVEMVLDGTNLLVSNYFSDSISVIDTTTNNVVATIR